MCITCPDGMYESNGYCKGIFLSWGTLFLISLECPENCATCTSATKCLSCNTGYYVWDYECLREKNTNVNIVVFGSVFIVESLVIVVLLLAIFRWIKVPK